MQVGELGERLVASRVPALVRLVTGVGPDVLLQVGQLGELPHADLTLVRLDPQVDPGMLGQVAGVGERLRTLGTLVRLLQGRQTPGQEVRLT